MLKPDTGVRNVEEERLIRAAGLLYVITQARPAVLSAPPRFSELIRSPGRASHGDS